jgi:hypothetical protein
MIRKEFGKIRKEEEQRFWRVFLFIQCPLFNTENVNLNRLPQYTNTSK